MEVGISARESSHAGARSRDKVVVDNVGIALAIAISSDVSTTSTPVIDDLIGCQSQGYADATQTKLLHCSGSHSCP